jgi:hypothetical protein
MDTVAHLTSKGILEVQDILELSKSRYSFFYMTLKSIKTASNAFVKLLEKNLSKIKEVRRETFQYGKEDRHKVRCLDRGLCAILIYGMFSLTSTTPQVCSQEKSQSSSGSMGVDL